MTRESLGLRGRIYLERKLPVDSELGRFCLVVIEVGCEVQVSGAMSPVEILLLYGYDMIWIVG
jgi:hypothetical protein